MTGSEYYDAVLKNKQLRKFYEENIHFNQQMQYIRRKEKVTKLTILKSLCYVCDALQATELRTIRMFDEEVRS